MMSSSMLYALILPVSSFDFILLHNGTPVHKVFREVSRRVDGTVVGSNGTYTFPFCMSFTGFPSNLWKVRL